MYLDHQLQQKNMTIYRLSKESGVPYATLNDICNGKTRLEKCSAETVYRIAHALDTPMDNLLAPLMEKRSSFELFKSSVCHRLKELGDIDFILDTLQRDEIRAYYQRKWYPESLYLLAMLDYISRLNNVPLCKEYDDLRSAKLDHTIYPTSVLAMCAVMEDTQAKEKARREAIPEFLKYNIIENEVRNVI